MTVINEKTPPLEAGLSDDLEQAVSPFADDEIEGEEKAEEDLAEEESGDEAGDEDKSEDEHDNDADDEDESEESDERDFEQEFENVSKALQAERTKRKGAAGERDSLRIELDTFKAQSDLKGEAFDKLVESLKAEGLSELVEIPKIGEVSAEVMEARTVKQEKANQERVDTFFKDAVTEARSIAPDFNNIDLDDETQGLILTNVVASMAMQQKDIGEAVADSMDLLNKLLGTVRAGARDTSRVKPKAKPKARTKKQNSSSFSQKVKKAGETGDFLDVFKSATSKFNV